MKDELEEKLKKLSNEYATDSSGYLDSKSLIDYDAGFRAGAEAQRELSGWCPIESAPKDGSKFIYLNSDQEVMVTYWHPLYKMWSVNITNDSNITHWQPLPDPPEAER